MTSGSSRASSPTGARKGLTQVMANATTQVATMVTPAAAALRSRAASSSVATSTMPHATRAYEVAHDRVRGGPTTTRSTARASTDDQIATRLTRR